MSGATRDEIWNKPAWYGDFAGRPSVNQEVFKSEAQTNQQPGA